MTLFKETKIFLTFVILGLLFSFIFDMFRAIRRFKKPNKYSVLIQDIIYFIIIGTILLVLLINVFNSEIRLYNILSIVLGVIIYISVFGNCIRNIFCKIFKFNNKIHEFIVLPLIIYTTIFSSLINKFKKNVIKCCKKILYMINFNCVINIIRNIKLKTKEDSINDKKEKSSY